MGVSRSATMVIAYLMLRKKMRLIDAVKLTRYLYACSKNCVAFKNFSINYVFFFSDQNGIFTQTKDF